jgi:predicted kinase
MKRKNPIVKILIGIPGAGKTTWCENFLMNNQDWLRVNRDDFRVMLRNENVCDFKVEQTITDISNLAITAALNNRYNVLVDNTHLKQEWIENLIEHVQISADIEFQVFDISLEKAIERDANRARQVGADTIKKMYKEYKKLIDSYPTIYTRIPRAPRIYNTIPYDNNLEDVYIFDIDGTLAHMNGKRGPYDWHRVDVDDADENVHHIFKMHMQLNHKIIVLSGRDGAARAKTEEWLDFYGLKYHALFMRPVNNFEKDSVIKKRIYENEIKGKYNVRVIYDDRDQVVRMWRELGLKVFQVNPGNF